MKDLMKKQSGKPVKPAKPKPAPKPMPKSSKLDKGKPRGRGC